MTAIRRVVVRNPNLLTNGNIEAAFSGTVSAFDDQFADLNAWTQVASPTVAANIVSLPTNAHITGGHSEWWDWSAGSRLRFEFLTGARIIWYVRFFDDNNWVRWSASDAGGFLLQVAVAGVVTARATNAITMVNGNWYWFQPVSSGTSFSCTIENDNAGAPGTNFSTIGATTVNDAPVSGSMRVLNVNAPTVRIGGAFADVCLVKIPAPPGWSVAVDAGVPAFAVSKTNRLSGLYSLSVHHNHSAAQSRWTNANPNPGTTYHASARLRASLITGTGTRFGSSGVATTSATGTADWATHTGTGVSSDGGAVRFVTGPTSGTAWADNMWFYAVPTTELAIRNNSSSIIRATSVTPVAGDIIDGGAILPVVFRPVSSNDVPDGIGVQKVWIVTPGAGDIVDQVNAQLMDIS